LVLRNEDLDRTRCRPAFEEAMLEDLTWFGLRWQEGPDIGGPYGPYSQSERLELYRAALDQLRAAGCVYPCRCSRQDVLRALQAPHAGEEEPVYPGTCRPKDDAVANPTALHPEPNARVNWRFRVPDGERVSFIDGHYALQTFVAGQDFGDFIVWRHDDIPAYHLAVVVDDAAMRVTEVVRGADLLTSTARQLLLYRALGHPPPAFYHCPLLTDEKGVRLAKRHDALSLRTLRHTGSTPESLRAQFD
jgi:glutamyl/glutaminyl-tRNA synthetase